MIITQRWHEGLEVLLKGCENNLELCLTYVKKITFIIYFLCCHFFIKPKL